MTKFQIKSDYKPTGDQPSAIVALTDGLKKGTKEQTLLGVTGSGRSVAGSSKVFIEHNGKTYYVSINTFDRLFEKGMPETDDATQVVILMNNDAETLALNTKTGQSIKASIKEITRHKYYGNLYDVSTSCGRSNTFTDSHNVYVLRGGELHLVRSDSLQVRDYLPIPENIAIGGKGVDYIDLREWLPEDNFYVRTEHVEPVLAQIVGRNKYWRLKNRNERLAMEVYKSLDRTVFSARHDRVSSSKLAASVPLILPSTDNLWRFLGLYIAEGHSTGRYVTVSTADPSIVVWLNTFC